MSTNPNISNRPSCMRRMLGTLTAFVLAAAVVYLASYVILFKLFGNPARNETGWLGPTLRLLQTGPVVELEGYDVYHGDTGPYTVFKPLNDLWLKTKTLPEVSAADTETAAGGGRGDRGGRGEGRRGGRGGEARGARGSRTDDSASTGSQRAERPQRNASATDDGESTTTERQRRGRGRARDRQTTGTASEPQSE